MSHFTITHRNLHFGTFSDIKNRAIVFSFPSRDHAEAVRRVITRQGMCLSMNHARQQMFEARYGDKDMLRRPVPIGELCIETQNDAFVATANVNRVCLFHVDLVTTTDSLRLFGEFDDDECHRQEPYNVCRRMLIESL